MLQPRSRVLSYVRTLKQSEQRNGDAQVGERDGRHGDARSYCKWVQHVSTGMRR